MSTLAEQPNASERGFGTREVERLTGVKPQTLRRWHRTGLLAAQKIRGRLAYNFSDVVAVRAAKTLIDDGFSSRDVKRSVAAIRNWRPDVAQPLAAVRVQIQGRKLLISMDGQSVEAESGQVLLDLDQSATAPPPALQACRPKDEDNPFESAAEAFEAGQMAEAEGQPDIAERHYRTAIRLEPDHAWAICSLGNLVYNRGDLTTACELYKVATQARPLMPQAWYNLANTLDELGQLEAAVTAYSESLRLDPDYSDAHFNAGLAWEKLGEREQARTHWEAFLRLAPKQHPSRLTALAFLSCEGDRQP